MAESNIPFSISCSNQFTTEPISPQTKPSQSTLSQNQDSNHHLMNQTSPISTSNLQITELKQNMNSNPNQTDHQISVADESPSFQPTPLRNHSLQSLIEQLLLPSTNSPNPAGLLHLRLEPIQLHINSSSQSQLPNQTGQSFPSRSPSKPASPTKEITQKEPSVQTLVNSLSQNKFKHKKVLEKSNSLANHLPTGTVLLFQALIPTFSNDGKCQLTNKYLIAWVIGICSLLCFLSSFTDSIELDGKVYYGIATFKGFWVFNYDNREEEEEKIKTDLKGMSIKKEDYIQAFGSLLVFLVFAFSCSDVQRCYWPHASVQTQNSIVVYLPIIVGTLSSFFFTIYSTKRTGIGFTSKAGKVIV